MLSSWNSGAWNLWKICCTGISASRRASEDVKRRFQMTHRWLVSVGILTGLIVDSPDGRLPPVTAEGQKRAAEVAAARKRMGEPTDAAQNMNLGDRCIMMANTAPMLPMGYMSTYQVVQAPGYVMILSERM